VLRCFGAAWPQITFTGIGTTDTSPYIISNVASATLSMDALGLVPGESVARGFYLTNTGGKSIDMNGTVAMNSPGNSPVALNVSWSASAPLAPQPGPGSTPFPANSTIAAAPAYRVGGCPAASDAKSMFTFPGQKSGSLFTATSVRIAPGQSVVVCMTTALQAAPAPTSIAFTSSQPINVNYGGSVPALRTMAPATQGRGAIGDLVVSLNFQEVP
jgi:hypothetical protein